MDPTENGTWWATDQWPRLGFVKSSPGGSNVPESVLPLPLPLARASARFFEVMPKPLLTRDQLKLLKYDNIASGKYKTNSDIGLPSKRYFEQEVKKYCYMWREGGQFSTEKYLSGKKLDN